MSMEIRVLHVVESLDSQAAEAWLLRMLRAMRNSHPHLHWTFFTLLAHQGRNDAAARALGADVIHSAHELRENLAFLRGLRRTLRSGRFDVLHCHHDVMSAAYLLAAAGLPIRRRIVHAHNTSMHIPSSNRMKVAVLREPMRQVCLRGADRVVGVSHAALESMTGSRQPGGRFRVVHCAIDTARFAGRDPEASRIRAGMGLEQSARVLLFVGRMVDYKNPVFVVEILARLAARHPDLVAVFAGTGPLEGAVREMARATGLEGRVRLAGFREDVADVMLASDVLAWPSVEHPREGLGLGVIEAQAAGLPVVMSRGVPDDAILVPELVDVVPLAAGPAGWSEAISRRLRSPAPDRMRAWSAVDSSSFSMKAGVANLMALYED